MRRTIEPIPDRSSVDPTWTNSVDADAFLSVLPCGRFRQTDDSVLGCRIGGSGREGIAANTVNGGVVHHGARACLQHRPNLVFHAQPDTGQIPIHLIVLFQLSSVISAVRPL